MAKQQSMSGKDNTIPGDPNEYFEMTTGGGDIYYPASDSSGRSTGARILEPLPKEGGTPAMVGVLLGYANSNEQGIQSSTSQTSTVVGAAGAKVNPGAPFRRPV